MSFIKGAGFIHDADAISQIAAASDAQAEDMRTKLNSHVGFYENFTRHADGLVAGGALSPEVGGESWGLAGNRAPVIANGGLVSQLYGNYYMASTAACPEGVIDATFEVEVRQDTLLLTVATKAMTITLNNQTIASTGHGFVNGTNIVLTTTNTLPTGLVNGGVYVVRNSTADAFQLSLTAAGAIITPSGSQSGSHSCNFAHLTTAVAKAMTITLGNQTIASTAHGYTEGTRIMLTTSGALPTGLSDNGIVYFVRNPAPNSFQLSLTDGGSVITPTVSQSGAHTSNYAYTDRLLVPAWNQNGRLTWSNTGDQSTDTGRTIVRHTSDAGGTWQILHYNSAGVLAYHATKVSTLTSPLTLTAWTLVVGAGQPTFAARYGSGPPGFTFAYKVASPILGQSGGGPEDSIHINLDPGAPAVSRYVPVGSPTVTLRTVVGSSSIGPAPNRVHRFRVWAKGTRLLVFYPGAMFEYEISDGASMIGPVTNFYFQSNRGMFPGLFHPTVRPFTALRRMWINSPFHDQTSLDMGSGLMSGGDAVHPAQLDIRTAGRPFGGAANARFSSGAPLAVGATVNDDGSISGTSIYADGKIMAGTGMTSVWSPGFVPVYHNEAQRTAPLQSLANAVATSQWFQLFTPIFILPGSLLVQQLSGTFGPSGSKEILVRSQYGGWTTLFTTGTVAQNNGLWTMEIRRIAHTENNRVLLFKFWCATTGYVTGTYIYNRDVSQWDPITICVVATTLGDVTLLEQTSVLHQA